jgi:hypothetical protein
MHGSVIAAASGHVNQPTSFEGDRRGSMKATVTRDERTFYVEDRRPGAIV